MKTIKIIAAPLFASVLAFAAIPAHAAGFPDKPVEMTVLFGGSAQTVGQVLADQMTKKLGSPVVAVARKGGGGAIGYTYVHSTAADGYNIVWNSNSISTTHYSGHVPFDYKSFTPIARIGMEVPVLAVNTKSGWKTLRDMAAAGKKEKLKIAVGGLGSFTHLVAAALFHRLGVEVNYIPGGQGREVAELLAGRVDGVLRFPSEVESNVKAGSLRVLCVTTKDVKVEGLDAPTCDQAGATGLDLSMWRGLAAPAGTPPDVIAKLQKAAQEAVASPEFQTAVKHVGFMPSYLPAAKFGQEIATDDKEIGGLMKQIGLEKKK
ncbi:MAG TPA: tripartite tricarboxylate transporter substrate binding protein [Pseudolabrys sp.]|jgi:tripartite-type tricarboxylate transporter receptor subunit TctC|nr:tripartite tricarboxylate transporter substrate binding protein [Pseudolabrys sp.]